MINYDKSLVSLSNSLLKYYGVEPLNTTLTDLDRVLQKGYKKIVLMCFDGLGTYNLDLVLQKDAFLQENRYKTISSTFPPTTTAATTSLITGLYPSEHLYLGWSSYFKEENEYVNLYLNTNFKGETSKINVKEKLPFETIIQKISKVTSTYYLSPFGTTSYSNTEDSFIKLNEVLNESNESFTYYYNAYPDSYMHEFGVKDKSVIDCINKINTTLDDFSKKHLDTLFIVTADHGHIDVEEIDYTKINEFNDLIDGYGFCEPRCFGFNLKQNCKDKLIEVYNNKFKDDFLLFSKEQVIEKQLHGFKTVKNYRDYLAEYYLISISNKILVSSELQNYHFKGHHAGFTDNEMNVPLILINK